jgi:hypothetical protein
MISSKTAVKLSIYSVSGVKLAGYQLIVNEVNTIPAPHAAGIYIFVLEDAQGNIQTEKAIVR